MARLFSVGEVLAATGGRGEGLSQDGICSISIDSREIGPDALFVAIKGDVHDGHDFVRTAIANGAVAALVSQEKAVDLGDKLIIVPDALEGLVNLARASRKRSHARIVGVTGSVGKTTTKEAIRTIFEAAGHSHASIRSFNNHWGVPLMLARMPPETRFAVFEMGMNHAHEITPLSQLVRPQVAVITAIAPAHLETLGSLEAIADAKSEIFDGLEPGGTAVINTDHGQLDRLLAAARRANVGKVITFGFAPGADWHIEDIQTEGALSIARVRHGSESIEFAIGAHGRHMVSNALAALIAARECGIGQAGAIEALAGFGAQEGRGLRHVLGPAEKPLVLTDESYNANVASMRAAMEVFAQQKAAGGHKVLVLADMLELGPQGPAMHESLADAVRATGADRVYLIGPQMAALAATLGPGAVTGQAQTTQEIAESLVNSLAYGDAIMVKGSNGMKLGALVRRIRDQFA